MTETREEYHNRIKKECKEWDEHYKKWKEGLFEEVTN